MSGIYIHIPFCLRKCNYCDFLSFETSPRGLNSQPYEIVKKYVSSLLREIKQYKSHVNIDTIYIGGGTPTALPSPLLCEILTAVKVFPLIPRVEITVEANPGTLTPEYLAQLKKHGVTRLSMGLQTTKPRLLKAINRMHTMNDFLENFRAARKAGFDNINVDLMFALPGQTLQNWQDTLEEIIALEPEHISAYSLTPAENTPLYDALNAGEINLPCEKTDREMYHMARKLLVEAKYIHYELSNFAKRGYESRHNINCWRRVPYRGFGLGAHSFNVETRLCNTENIKDYIVNLHPPQNAEKLTEADAQTETMILGLRLMEGIHQNNIPHIFSDEVAEQIKKGLLVLENGFVKLTPLGMDLANQVFCAFM